MRFNFKLMVTLALATVVFVSVTLWTKCVDGTKEDYNFFREDGNSSPTDPDHDQHGRLRVKLNQVQEGDTEEEPSDALPYNEIDCLINGEYTIKCRREQEDVYMPFSFISNYFEVYGKMLPYNGGERFEWQHSYARIYPQKGKYRPDGVLMSFEHYNVEVRDRVKCISAMEGVPLSTQWLPQGYFYAIQIGQYGLSHYSKYLVERESDPIMLEDAEDASASRWKIIKGDSRVNTVIDRTTGSRVIHFNTPDSLKHPGVKLPIDKSGVFFVSFDFKFSTNGSVTIVLESPGKDQPYYLHYVCSTTVISADKNQIYYGLGTKRTKWSRVTRDVAIDLQKGVYLHKHKKVKMAVKRIVSIHVRGNGWIDNITVASDVHLPQFYAAADWMVRHQDSKGGWPIKVKRRLASGMLELKPGWYSAMAQGHGMSLLTRAYHLTRNKVYLEAALKAIHLYNVSSSMGGVRATFMDRYTWYEEYPTTPSSFVLNGFIYALIGLYDLKHFAPASKAQEVAQLYSDGMVSLRAMLPMFDTGSGSIYDLRHITIGVAPNLARWDYHATHINQLLLLATIDNDPFFRKTVERWIGYMKGIRAPHN